MNCAGAVDVAGNNYRVILIVRCRDGKLFVRWVVTRREYDNRSV